MKILFTSSECVPFIKTGGLADVVGALAPVLAKKGHDVRVVLPLYTAIDSKWQQQMEFQLHFEVQLGWRRQYCGVNMLKKDGVTYYFLDNKFYFGRPYVYGLGGDEYERYSFFCRAVLNAMPLLDFKPDIIHAHDWQSGMVPALLKIQYAHLPFYSKIRTVFTIHNLQYQGVFPIKAVQDTLGLGQLHEGRSGLCGRHYHRKPQLCRGDHHRLLRRAAGRAHPRPEGQPVRRAQWH